MRIPFLFAFFFFIQISSRAADSLWHFIPEKNIKAAGERKIIPQKYLVLQLNDSLFKLLQSKTPKGLEEGIEWKLPTPDGKWRLFKMRESTVMAPELAERYPELKTYGGSEIINPAVTAKLDHTEAGFHAMILDGDDTYFIDPFSNKPTNYYICYYKRNYDKPSSEKLQETTVKKKCCKKKCRHKKEMPLTR